MDLLNILGRNRELNENAAQLFAESDITKKNINHFIGTSGLGYREIYSTHVFPQIYTLNDDSTLIWDLSLWHIFRNFLIGYYTYEEAKRVDDKNAINAGFQCMKTMVYFYLALRFRESSKLLSCNFAFQYRLCRDSLEEKFASIDNNVNIDKLVEDIVETSKIFCFWHEIYHLLYNFEDEERKESFIDLIKDFLPYLKAETRGISENDLKLSFELLRENKSFFSELYCDRYAMLETHAFHRQESDSSKKDLLFRCLESYYRFMHFYFFMNNTEKICNIYLNEYNELISADEAKKRLLTPTSTVLIRRIVNKVIISKLFAEGIPDVYKEVDLIYKQKTPYIEHEITLLLGASFSTEEGKKRLFNNNDYIKLMNVDFDKLFCDILPWNSNDL